MEDEMRNFSIFMVLVVFLVIMTVSALPALAGGPAFPGFYLWINEIPGQSWSGSGIDAWINNEDNIPFVYPANHDQFTVAYWLNGSEKLMSQAQSIPNEAGDIPFEGRIEVGSNDPRTTLTLDWIIYNYWNPVNWYVSIYRIDTRSRVFSKSLSPESANAWGTIEVPMSRQGYDVYAVAWGGSTVPEPGSVLALGTGLLGLLGLATRKKH